MPEGDGSKRPPPDTEVSFPALVDPNINRSRSTISVALGLLVNAVISAIQAVAVTLILGVSADTDAFFAAYSLYLPVVLLGSTFRSQLVPLFGVVEPEAAFRVRATDLCGRALLVGAIFSAALIMCAPLSARFVASGLPNAAQHTAVLALLILGPVAYFQFHGVTISALLAATQRLPVSSAIYVAAAAVGLAFSLILLPVVGTIGAPLGLSVGAATLAGGHEFYVRRYGVRVRIRPRWLFEAQQWKLLLSLSGYAALAVAQQFALAMALGKVSGGTGQITIYTFAFILVVVLLSVASVALGLALMPDLVKAVAARGRDGASEYFLRVITFTAALAAPLVIAVVLFGRPILELALGPSLSPANLDLMFGLIRIFAMMVLPLAIMQTAIAVGVAFRRWRFMSGLAVAWVALQFIAVNVAASGGPRSVAVAQVVTTSTVALLLVAGLFGRGLWALLWTTMVVALKATALTAVIVLVRLPFGEDPSAWAALVGVVAALSLYLAALRAVWPAVGVPLLAGVRRAMP